MSTQTHGYLEHKLLLEVCFVKLYILLRKQIIRNIGLGFSVYTIGGSAGLEGAQFNKIISRYCLLSKKWYYEAHLPVPRRHMIAVFLRNKLVLVGGVGKHRLKLSSVDILNIHTG